MTLAQIEALFLLRFPRLKSAKCAELPRSVVLVTVDTIWKRDLIDLEVIRRLAQLEVPVTIELAIQWDAGH